MKTSRILLFTFFTIITISCFLPNFIYGQNAQDSIKLNKSFKNWRHYKKYNSIISQKIFTSDMTDDEMAGIELWRGGRNLKMAIAFEIVGVVVISTGNTIVQLIDDSDKADIVRYIASGIGLGFFIAGLCELVSGYNKIGKAGIIFQHKKFNIKTTGTSVSMNF